MTQATIEAATKRFVKEVRRIYGTELENIYLYGSCARKDFQADSDIDLFLLLNVPVEDLAYRRSLITDTADQIDLDYDVVLSPVVQSTDQFKKYSSVSPFYQNIIKEGIPLG